MMFVPVEDMIALTKIPLYGIDTAQLQRMTQQRADSQIGILLLVTGAMFSILSASLPVVFDDNMNWKGAVWAVIIVGMFLAASVYISSRLQQGAYKKAVARIKLTVGETYPTYTEKPGIASSSALSKDRLNSSQ
jgi:drug/metabolite transporter (DMT)-like permease